MRSFALLFCAAMSLLWCVVGDNPAAAAAYNAAIFVILAMEGRK